MNIISDADLLLFHYRDGLEPARLAQIEDELLFDAALRGRLAALRETLTHVAADWPSIDPAADLEARVWARLQPTLPPRKVKLSRWRRLTSWMDVPPAPRLVFASLMAAALALGYLLGRQTEPTVAAPAMVGANLLADDASSRVLAAYLSNHLQRAERAMLVASNSPQDGAAATNLAKNLLDSNRLYALAAERAGKPALGQFLRELEPVLIELASEGDVISPALGKEIRRRDLAFRTRAAAALARQNVAQPDLGDGTQSL
ncbi:MAG: hypothetical protein ACT4NL_18450 [Pseudomarimonas sp.]